MGLCLGPKVSALCQSCPHKRTRATFSLLTHQGVTLMNFLHFIPHNEGNSAVEQNSPQSLVFSLATDQAPMGSY